MFSSSSFSFPLHKILCISPHFLLFFLCISSLRISTSHPFVFLSFPLFLLLFPLILSSSLPSSPPLSQLPIISSSLPLSPFLSIAFHDGYAGFVRLLNEAIVCYIKSVRVRGTDRQPLTSLNIAAKRHVGENVTENAFTRRTAPKSVSKSANKFYTTNEHRRTREMELSI